MPTALVVMAVVLVVVGAGSYVAFGTQKPTVNTSTSCEPANSAACAKFSVNHDVTLLSPFAAAQTNQTIPFSVVLPTGASSTNMTYNFGDGSAPVQSNSQSATHQFQYPGLYIVSVQANIKGTVHDNYQHLIVLTITASGSSQAVQNVPAIVGQITKNSSGSSTAPSAILQPGGSITVSGTYTSAPTNPLFTEQTPTITASGTGVSVATPTTTPTGASATVTFQNSGIFAIEFVGKSAELNGTTTVATATQDFVWTAFVAPSGVNAGTSGAAAAVSPHTGTFLRYFLAPGGSRTHDPSVEYDSASGEVVTNIYQTLIQYNGTDAGPLPSQFVPDAAACVPGSGQCGTLFPSAPAGAGTDLVNTTTGAYTFVLTSNSQFYDSATSTHWGVYPSDVMFTLIRTEAFGNLPYYEANNGWLVGQALVNPGSAAWDSGIHAAMNNTPSNEFASILVNASAYCPTEAMTSSNYHGCVTLLAKAGGVNWPFFLELVADPTGTGIEPCGWYSAPAQAAGVPDWTMNGKGQSIFTGSGDRPCLLPGNATTTDSAAYGSAVSGMGAKDWDTWQTDGSSPPYVGHVQWSTVGSGPYYMKDLVIGASYTLAANPAYTPNPDCTWTGCMPAVGGYVPNVDVVWESSQIQGEKAYQAGVADAASIPSTDTAILLQLLQQGKVIATEAPTISEYFWLINMNFSLPGAQKYTTNPITVPQTFFAPIGIREFFVHAFPYQTVQSTINTVDGITYDFAFGGAIPKFMGNYYPTNISWPSGNPGTDPNVKGSAAWWWAQANDPSSPFYDSFLTNCTVGSPCQVPWFGETGAPAVDAMASLLQSEINSLSGGRVKLLTLDINFANLVDNLETSPGYNPMPIYQLGWAPDYPDPTDYISVLYGNGAGNAASDDVGVQLLGTGSPFNKTSYAGGTCPGATDYVSYAHLAQSLGGIPNTCQGPAFAAMNYAMTIAATYSPNASRVLLYNYAEQIGNGLALYVYWGQTNLVVTMAPWVNPATPNTSVMFGGGNEQTYWTWNGNGMV